MSPVESPFCGPRISAHALSLDGKLDFYLKILFYLLFENDLESPLIFILFFKRVNKIRKKNPKCDSLFWKRWSVKNRIGFEGQVTYREGTILITTKKCYFVDLIIMVLSTFE